MTPSSPRIPSNARYRAMLAEAINDEDLAAIRLYLHQQRAYGRYDFRAMAEAKTQRFAGVRPAHRPAKSSATMGQVNLTPLSPQRQARYPTPRHPFPLLL